MRFCLLFIAAIAADAADDPYAAALFKKHCASCHESASAAAARIPPLATLKILTPTVIFRTLDSGAMKAQAAPLSVNERQAVANFLGTSVTSERKRDQIANPCPAGAGWKDGPGWASWGPGLANTRFQEAKEAGLTAKDVPKLAPRWVFAFPDTTVLRSQPAVYRGRVFVGAQDGSTYSLDGWLEGRLDTHDCQRNCGQGA